MVDSDRPPDDEFERAIAEISKRLDQGERCYSVQQDKDGQFDGGRFGVCAALHAAIELLKAVGATSGQLKPLNRLVAALDDLDHGKVPDLLAAKKVSNRPPNSYLRELLKAYAVAALDLFMAGGMSEKDGSALVARRLRSHGYVITQKVDADHANVVRNWRKSIDSNPARDRRDHILNSLASVESSAEAKAEKLLKQLPGVVPVKS